MPRRRVSGRGVAAPPPREQNDMTGVKILPCPNFVAGGNNAAVLGRLMQIGLKCVESVH